jgi:hypothetical protein
MDSGNIADLMPRFMRRPSGVEDNAFPRREYFYSIKDEVLAITWTPWNYD